MFSDLQGKKVLITGSTAGIGLAIAEYFVAHGALVAINGRVKNDAAQLALDALNTKEETRAIFLAGDLTDTNQCQALVDAFVEHFGSLDVLINNAGGLGGRSGLEQIDDAFYDHVMDLNARSALMVTKFAIPYLKASASARGETASVISTGSVAAREGGGLGAGVYAASKAWLHNINRNWVKEFSADLIRFNVISPGTIDTAFHEDKSDELKEKIRSSIPMGRFGEPKELAPAFAFLASHACSGYITGQVLDVNGGQLCP